MNRPDYCPECESSDTDVQHVSWYRDHAVRVRTCNNCPTQYTVIYEGAMIDDVKTFGDAE